MNTTIDIPAFLSACEFVKRMIPPRVIVPLLGCIRIDASDADGMVVSHSGHEGSARAVVSQCDVTGDGAVAVDAATMIAALRSLDGKTATMTLDAGKLRIVSNRRKVALGTFPVDDIPDPRKCIGKPTAIDGKFLAHALDVAMPVAKNASADRFAMRGMFFDGDGTTLHCVATDGKRLHMVAGPWGGEIKAIIPCDTMPMVLDMASQSEALVLSSDANSISVTTDDRSITVALVVANFPPYAAVIPKDLIHVMNVDARMMAEGVKSVGFMVTDDENAKRGVGVRMDGGVLTLSAADVAKGDANATLDVDNIVNEYEASYNDRYLREGFEAHDGQVSVLVSEKRLGNGPIVVRSGDTTTAMMPVAKG